jgi:hypothetical protein
MTNQVEQGKDSASRNTRGIIEDLESRRHPNKIPTKSWSPNNHLVRQGDPTRIQAMKNLSSMLARINMVTNKILLKNRDVLVSNIMSINNHMPAITPQTGTYKPKNNMMHINITNEDDQVSTNHQLGIEWSKTNMDLKMEVKLRKLLQLCPQL